MNHAIDLDVHAHLVPAHYPSLRTFDGVRWLDAERALEIDGHRIGLQALFDAAGLLHWMDGAGVAAAWISPPPPTYRPHLAAEDALAWSDALQEGLSAMARADRARLRVMRYLPVEHPDVAAEIVRANEGAALFTMATGGPGIQLSRDAYDPLWQTLDASAAVLFLHPGEGCDERLSPYYLNNLLGNPAETGLAVAHLVFGGVLARYPRIAWVLAHGGGTAPMLAGRWQRGWETSRPGIERSIPAPVDQLPRLRCDCITHSRAALDAATAAFGEKAVVFGSDWPFPMGILSPDDQLAWLPATARAQMVSNGRVLARYAEP